LITPVTAAVQSGRAALSVWVRGNRAALRVAIVWFDSKGRQVGQRWTSLRARPRWHRASVAGTPPASAAFARILLHVQELKGAVWVDDVSFRWR
jgi:hypothetical protein